MIGGSSYFPPPVVSWMSYRKLMLKLSVQDLLNYFKGIKAESMLESSMLI